MSKKQKKGEEKRTTTAAIAAADINEPENGGDYDWDDYNIIKTKSVLVADCGGSSLTLCFAEICCEAHPGEVEVVPKKYESGRFYCGWCDHLDGTNCAYKEKLGRGDPQKDTDYHVLFSKGKGFNPFLSKPEEMKERIVTVLSKVPENQRDGIHCPLPTIYECVLRTPGDVNLLDYSSSYASERLNGLMHGKPFMPSTLDEIHWYGAGCETPETAEKVKSVLESIFCSRSDGKSTEPKKKKSKTGAGKVASAASPSHDSDSNPCPKIFIYHDLLAAARTTCGKEPGQVAILGTGSNSCFYDGTNIVEQGPSLGYLLGDEGSGYDLGKTLIREYLLGRMPDDVAASFKKSYLSKGLKGGSWTEYEPDAKLLQEIYGDDQPNSHLARFAQFYQYNSGLSDDSVLYLNELAKSRFREFIHVNLKQYKQKTSNKKDGGNEKMKDGGNEKMKINFVGSIAHNFKDLIEPVLHEAGFEMGTIAENGGPLELDILYDLGDLWANSLIEFHLMPQCKRM